jgi:hypothetical protein
MVNAWAVEGYPGRVLEGADYDGAIAGHSVGYLVGSFDYLDDAHFAAGPGQQPPP